MNELTLFAHIDTALCFVSGVGALAIVLLALLPRDRRELPGERR